MTETATETVLEVFIPGPGENPEDPQDMERSIFLGAAQEALDSGVEIEVYSTDSYPSAFEECAPVAEQIEMNGREVLPLMLVNGEVKVSFTYPTAEQIKRFSRAHMVSQPKANAAAGLDGHRAGGGNTVAGVAAHEVHAVADVRAAHRLGGLAGQGGRKTGGLGQGAEVRHHGGAGRAARRGGCVRLRL